MLLFIALSDVNPWNATVKMVVNCVGHNTIHNTTAWLAYASWTWEVLRRNPDYCNYYKSLKNKGLEIRSRDKDAPLIIASKHYPTANKAGLLLPVDPELDAFDSHAFWHPDVMKSVVRFHVVNEGDIDRRNKPIQLSKFPAKQSHFLDANGTYHIRLLGKNFWFQIQCDGITAIDGNAYIGFENNRVENYDRRAKAQSQIFGIYDGVIPLDSPLHVPARLTSHQKAMIAHDIQADGGILLDIVSALFEVKLLEDDPTDYRDYRDYIHHAKNAIKRGKAYIYGDYLAILDKQ